MAPESKTNASFDTASISTSSDSIRDEKERAQQAGQPKESLTRKVIKGMSKPTEMTDHPEGHSLVANENNQFSNQKHRTPGATDTKGKT
jgi:hypothetical protein